MTSVCASPGARVLPAHLAALAPDEWALWRWFALRGAGFPVHLASRLSAPECARSADALLSAEGRAQAARSAALDAVNSQLDDLAKTPGPKHEEFYQWVAILRALRSGKAPAPSPRAVLDPLLRNLCVQETLQRSCLSQYEAAFTAALLRQSTAVLEIARDPSFQEALVWQNRLAFENTVRPLTELGPAQARDKKQRHFEELVANYLQRYTTKNDTIGFFGPVAWGAITDAGPALAIAAGPSLVRRRRVYFEEWGIGEVAAAISSMAGMRAWIAPRIGPSLRIAGHSAHVPGAPPMPLDALTETVLENCTGEIAANRLPALIRRNPSLVAVTDEEIERLLGELAEKALILWRFAVPMEPNPEAALRSALECVGDAGLRARALAVLDRLEEKRRDVARSAGCVQALAPALGALDREFREITGKDAQRNAGVTYASRTLVYEDCQRDLDIRLSEKLFEPIAPALSLLLTGVRWFVQSMAAAFQSAVESAYEEVAAALGTPEVPAGLLWLKLQPMIFKLPPPAQAVERLLDEKWAGILKLDAGVRECRFDSRKLRPLVESAFPVLPGAVGTPRYFCPDLMLAAPSLEAIERGEALYVMGELHLSVNTLSSALFVEQHPDARVLADAVAWDFPDARVRAIHSPRQPRVSVRTNPVLMRDRDVLVAWGHDTIPPTGLRAHPMSTLVVRKTAQGFEMTTRDGRCLAGIMEAFAAPLCELLINNARFIPASAYTPRVLIGNLVISRETWNVPVRELTFAFEKQERRRFLGSRRWAAARGLPDIFFVKSPSEIKPSCIHLDSPVYVEILSKIIRGLHSERGENAQMKFSEMLPAPGQTWLADSAGNRYTSELRFAILDLRARDASLPERLDRENDRQS